MASSIDDYEADSNTDTDHDFTKEFFGVYLLYCLNPRYKGRIYIGFTVDPNRRVHQHNTGHQAGGACRTSGRGPWEMLVITHGFPNAISALRFEWAWQNPDKSRRVRAAALESKSKKETGLQYRIRVLGAMLNSGPWNRLALTVRWLRPEFSVQFPTNMRPPSHMPLVFGPLAQQSAAPHRHESRAQKHTSKSQKKSRRHRAPSTDEEVDVESNAGSDVDLNTDVQSATHLRLTRCAVCKQTLHANDAELARASASGGGAGGKQKHPESTRTGRGRGGGMPKSSSVRYVLCPTTGCAFQAHVLCCANTCRQSETEMPSQPRALPAGAASDGSDTDTETDARTSTSLHKRLDLNAQPLIPLRVRCPLCLQIALWGDLLRHSRSALMSISRR